MTHEDAVRATMRVIRPWLLLWLAILTWAAPACAAQVVLVVLSDNTAPYQEVLQALDAGLLPPRYQVRVASPQQIDAGAPQAQGADLIVTLGVQAAERLGRLPPAIPALAALIPRDWYAARGQALLLKRHNVTVLFLDQPLARQMRLLHAALPEAREIGVVLSPQRTWLLPRLEKAAQKVGLKLNAAVLGPRQSLVMALDRVLSDSDLLLALPDPEVFNSATAQTVFLTAYRYREPVVGYSASMTRAGALISFYSTPAQIGRQAAALATRILASADKSLPPQYPAEYSIATNNYVARSLGMRLPSERAIRKSMDAAAFWRRDTVPEVSVTEEDRDD